MKCPYRKVVTVEKESSEKTVTEENFCDCYGTGCPFFRPLNGIPDQCMKAEREKYYGD